MIFKKLFDIDFGKLFKGQQMDYYKLGYDSYEPTHDQNYPPYPTELDNSSSEEYFAFDEGYETAKLDFLWDHVEAFVKNYHELLNNHGINELDCEFEKSIEIKPGQSVLFTFTLEDFENYL